MTGWLWLVHKQCSVCVCFLSVLLHMWRSASTSINQISTCSCCMQGYTCWAILRSFNALWNDQPKGLKVCMRVVGPRFIAVLFVNFISSIILSKTSNILNGKTVLRIKLNSKHCSRNIHSFEYLYTSSLLSLFLSTSFCCFFSQA